MADLKKVMEKLNSQKSTKDPETAKPAKLPAMPKKATEKAVKKAVVEEEEDLVENDDEELDEEEDQETEEEAEEEPTEEATEAVDPATQINAEIERLQNNGVFRAELLYQLIGINENLKVLNHLILKALGGQDGKGTK